MNICKFKYFLKDDEIVRGIFSCKLKAFVNLQMIEEKGIIIASDSRLIFCNTIGDHYNFIVDFNYSYITSLKVKELSQDEKYLTLYHNGDLVKITDILEEDINDIIKYIEVINVII